MIIDLPFWSMKTFEINDYSLANDRTGNHKAIGLIGLQTPMIGRGTPAQMAISHLLRNQIVQ